MYPSHVLLIMRVCIVVPPEMDEALTSFQSTINLLSQSPTNYFTDSVQRQHTVIVKIERLL